MNAPAARASGGGLTGLIYVVLLLLVLGGGGAAVWLLYKNANKTTPAPAPTPAPTAPLNTWTQHPSRWVDNSIRNLPAPALGIVTDLVPPSFSSTISPSMSLDDCQAVCTQRPATLKVPEWSDATKDYVFSEIQHLLTPSFPFPVNATPGVQALSHVDVKPGDPYPCQCTTHGVPVDWTTPAAAANFTYPWKLVRSFCVGDVNYEPDNKAAQIPTAYATSTNYDSLLGGLSCAAHGGGSGDPTRMQRRH